MQSENRTKTLRPAIGLAWCVIVSASYYFFNLPYYGEKISVFGDFFLSFLR